MDVKKGMDVKMRRIYKVSICIIIYTILIQIFLSYLVSDRVVYQYRMNYDLVKDRVTNIEAVLEKIKHQIDSQQLKEYYVILGDSVAFSNPGPADKSLVVFLEKLASEQGKDIHVFNLALPAMQTGDVYTMMLKMMEYDISLENVIINLTYAGFVARNPDPPIVFWLDKQLNSVDSTTYTQISEHLVKNNRGVEKGIKGYKQTINDFLYSKISLFKYKDYTRVWVKQIYSDIKGRIDMTADIQPWYTKDYLSEILKQPMYTNTFSDKPFVMDENNLNIYFLNKIFNLQRGKNTLFFLSAMNDEFLKEFVEKSGYQENMKSINTYMLEGSEKYGFEYVDYNGKIEYALFSDHIHLIPKGYEYLAEQLWDRVSKWDLE